MLEPLHQNAEPPTATVYKGHIANGVVVLDDGAALPDGTTVEVVPVPSLNGPSTKPAAGVLLPEWDDLIGSIDDLPADFAAQHDHYIHGAPKR